MSNRKLFPDEHKLVQMLRDFDDKLKKMERQIRELRVVAGTPAALQAGKLLRMFVTDSATAGTVTPYSLLDETTQLVVDIQGAGGGGGNAAWAAAGDTAAGGGGGSGAFTRKYYPTSSLLTGGMTLYYKLASPGVGGAASTTQQNGTAALDTKWDCGADGSTPALGSIVLVTGGGGGNGCAVKHAGDVFVNDGGARGAPGTTDSMTLAIAGSHGGVGLIISNSDGTVGKARGGFGAGSHLGGDIQGGFDSGNDGQPGSNYGGGGGGGASSSSGPSRKGGDGGAPVIIIYEFS